MVQDLGESLALVWEWLKALVWEHMKAPPTVLRWVVGTGRSLEQRQLCS